MSKIPNIETRNINKNNYNLFEDDVDDSDADLYEEVLSNMSSLKGSKTKKKIHALKRNEYYEDFTKKNFLEENEYSKDNKNILKKNLTKKKIHSKGRKISHRKRKISIVSIRSNKESFYILNKKKKTSEPITFLESKYQKNKEDFILKKNLENVATRKKLEKSSKIIKNEEVWDYIDNLSKNSLCNFISKLKECKLKSSKKKIKK